MGTHLPACVHHAHVQYGCVYSCTCVNTHALHPMHMVQKHTFARLCACTDTWQQRHEHSFTFQHNLNSRENRIRGCRCGLCFVAFLLTGEPSAVPRGWTTTRRFPAPGTEAWALFVREPGGGGGTFSSRSHTEDNSHTSFQVTVPKPSSGKLGLRQRPGDWPRPPSSWWGDLGQADPFHRSQSCRL